MSGGTAPELRTPGNAALVRLVAAREISTRIRDKTFLISSAILLLVVLGAMVFQAILASRATEMTVGVVGDQAVERSIADHAKALDVQVTVVRLADEAAARAAIDRGDVDGALVQQPGRQPVLLVERTASGPMQTVVQGAVGDLAVSRQLAEAGISRLDVPRVQVAPLKPQEDQTGERVGVAMVGMFLLYTLLLLMGNFVAQGVVEEKSSRVVELLLATMRPWQLLAGKILGLGLLGLAQIVLLSVVGVVAALVSGVITLPGQLFGTVLGLIGWFVLGYAFYAALLAAAASLVSRQEDLASVVTPVSVVVIVGVFVAIQAAQNPSGTLATVTSYIPGISPLVMPVRLAAGGASWWEALISAAIMLVAIAVVVRIGGRIYAGALLRTSGKTKIREALRADAA